MNLAELVKNYVNTHVYLLFRAGHPILNKTLKKDFAHIDVVTTMPPADNFILFVPTGIRIMCFSVCFDGFDEILKDSKYKNILEIELDAEPSKKLNISFPHILSCTTFAKSMVGVHNKTIITPYQLYKYLTKLKKTPNVNASHIKNIYTIR